MNFCPSDILDELDIVELDELDTDTNPDDDEDDDDEDE